MKGASPHWKHTGERDSSVWDAVVILTVRKEQRPVAKGDGGATVIWTFLLSASPGGFKLAS